jgi:lysyl-tRNA synthetase class II
MVETAGIALGVDRLAMALWDKLTIDEVVPFVPEDL